MILFFKILFLFLGIWFTIINIAKIIVKSNISVFNFFVQTVGITGFIILQFVI